MPKHIIAAYLEAHILTPPESVLAYIVRALAKILGFLGCVILTYPLWFAKQRRRIRSLNGKQTSFLQHLRDFRHYNQCPHFGLALQLAITISTR